MQEPTRLDVQRMVLDKYTIGIYKQNSTQIISSSWVIFSKLEVFQES